MITLKTVVAALLLLLALAPWPARAAQAQDPAAAPPADKHEHRHEAAPSAPSPLTPAPLTPAPWSGQGPAPSAPVGAAAGASASGIKENLGAIIPAGIILRDEQGRAVDLQALIDKPAVIGPVFFSCTAACNTLLSNLAAILPQTGPRPGADYVVLSVSFDETETPQLAASKKNDYITATRGGVAPEAWRFLTGDAENVRKFLNAAGFTVSRAPQGFNHPVALVVAAPGGKIARYLYGQTFMPFDISMAVNEAAEGKVSLSIHRVISYCFAYDPEARRYVFNFMRVAGAIIIFGLTVFFVILVSGKKPSAGRGPRKG